MKKLKEVMSKNVQCMSPEASIRVLAIKMKDLDVGVIPICQNERLVGMVTDRDIVLKTFAGTIDPKTATARDVMSSPVVFCYEDQDIGEASRLMEVRKIRRLVVLDRNKKLVGIVSLGDLAVRGGNESIAGETLEKVSEPSNERAA